MDTKQFDLLLHDDPMQDYEDVGVEIPVNPLPIPPKPQAKVPLKKPAITATSTRHASSGHQGSRKPVPAKRPQHYTQFQGQVQQPRRSPSPIYESPD